MFILGILVGLVVGAYLSKPILSFLTTAIAWIKTKLSKK